MVGSKPDMKNKPTLLVLASTYPRWAEDHEPGFVHELAKRLVECFHVIVLCPHTLGAASAEVMDGVEVVRYRYAPQALETLVNDGGIVTNLKLHRWKLLLVPSFVLMQAWQAWRLCSKRQIDVVHAHWLIPQGLIAALLGKPFLVTSHGADLHALRSKPLQMLKRWVLQKARAATVVSSAMRDIAVQLGANLDKISVVPMGVDMTDRFVPAEVAHRSCSELLFVGRLVEKKGLRYLLEALHMVLRERPDVTLTIAGFGPDEQSLKTQTHELGLQHAVHFQGAVAQKDLPALYQRAALFVAPFVKARSGDQEGLPVALMEAVACGCPVVAGDVAGIGDLLGVLKEQICVDARNTKLLAEKICTELAHPECGKERACQVHRIASAYVDWNRISREYADLLSRMVIKK